MQGDLLSARPGEDALRVADRLKEGLVVTIFCDSAAKYLSERFWTEGAAALEPGYEI